MLKAEGVEIVGVLERHDGDVYLTHIKNFFDTAKVLNYSSRGGSLQRYLGFDSFSMKSGTKLRA
jgi:hypothetical protein